MKRTLRWAQWAVVATAVLLLFWVAASVGGWSADIRRLTTNVHGPLVADYRAESPQSLAPLSPEITRDASRDQAARVAKNLPLFEAAGGILTSTVETGSPLPGSPTPRV